MENLIKHPEFGEVRTVAKRGETWFVAQDVCDALGHTNASVLIQMLDDDERAKHNLGRQGNAWIVNESGLYNIMFQSRRPEARKFRKWVTGEVLPSIRKFGYYVHPSYMDKKQVKAMYCQLAQTLNQYLTEEDVKKVAHKFGATKWNVSDVIMGHAQDNAMMQELQRRAISNKSAEINAYDPEHLRNVIDKLKS